MFPSVEVRWFFTGQVPRPVLDWFTAVSPLLQTPPVRTDYYLRLPGNDALGVKWREGNLEAKRRERLLGATSFSSEIVGVVDAWRKWRFPLSGDASPNSVQSSPDWIGVRKARLLHGYRLEDGRATAVAPDAPEAMCHLELTQIRAADAIWWTLGCECYGDNAAAADNLRAVVPQALAQAPLLPLTVADSYAYPRWLLHLAD